MYENQTILFHVIKAMSAGVLESVQQSLDKETAELDDLANHMKTGSKLVREKERKLRHLRNRFYTDVRKL